jgi:hypothetical protein
MGIFGNGRCLQGGECDVPDKTATRVRISWLRRDTGKHRGSCPMGHFRTRARGGSSPRLLDAPADAIGATTECTRDGPQTGRGFVSTFAVRKRRRGRWHAADSGGLRPERGGDSYESMNRKVMANSD